MLLCAEYGTAALLQESGWQVAPSSRYPLACLTRPYRMHSARKDPTVTRSAGRADAPSRVALSGTVHVWSIGLAHRVPNESDWATLSAGETDRARRFHFERDRTAYVLAHAAVRQILSEYSGVSPQQLEFVVGPAGKPSISPALNAAGIEFNLSHSGEFALVAATGGAAVGVDIERWDHRVEFLQLAEHYFSVREREALSALVQNPSEVMQGFFQAWSRKEAYLKATGAGIAEGLHHFDVTLKPGEIAALLADRLDVTATERWVMRDLAVADGYSAALVVASPLLAVEQFKF